MSWKAAGFRGCGKTAESRAKALKNIPHGLKPTHSVGFIGIRRGGKSCPDTKPPRIEFFRSL
jgi:hypothetical protein